ncbi:hypothetical protein [Clostridium sp. Cult3]|uniref:hypothetical protein n=1 Tax=Clostridium sp. Cult3 TaxID=2079004 RepID=UPI001F3E0ABA|nr:hypothetical protein [Clostridium sp. Cult3]
MIYENPYCRKVKGSYILLVSCGYCKTDIAKYQKVGKGNLLRMHIDRIIKGSIDFSKDHGALICPNCGELLATRMTLKRENKDVYKMIRSTFNTRKVDS